LLNSIRIIWITTARGIIDFGTTPQAPLKAPTTRICSGRLSVPTGVKAKRGGNRHRIAAHKRNPRFGKLPGNGGLTIGLGIKCRKGGTEINRTLAQRQSLMPLVGLRFGRDAADRWVAVQIGQERVSFGQGRNDICKIQAHMGFQTDCSRH
jgi:hypothetical protein